MAVMRRGSVKHAPLISEHPRKKIGDRSHLICLRVAKENDYFVDTTKQHHCFSETH